MISVHFSLCTGITQLKRCWHWSMFQVFIMNHKTKWTLWKFSKPLFRRVTVRNSSTGIKVNQLDRINEKGFSRSRISSHVIEAYLIQVNKIRPPTKLWENSVSFELIDLKPFYVFRSWKQAFFMPILILETSPLIRTKQLFTMTLVWWETLGASHESDF